MAVTVDHITFAEASSHILLFSNVCVADAPNCRLFFTTDGSKPTPFQRKIGGREVTFKYIAPFSLKSGKRVVKAVSVSRYLIIISCIFEKIIVLLWEGKLMQLSFACFVLRVFILLW